MDLCYRSVIYSTITGNRESSNCRLQEESIAQKLYPRKFQTVVESKGSTTTSIHSVPNGPNPATRWT